MSVARRGVDLDRAFEMRQRVCDSATLCERDAEIVVGLEIRGFEPERDFELGDGGVDALRREQALA